MAATVKVDPAYKKVEAGESVQFTAPGATTWELDPPSGAGVIDAATGKYDAALLLDQPKATVRAKNSNGELIAEAVLEITLPELKVLPDSVELKAGQAQHFTVEPKAYEREVDWTLEPPSMGRLTDKGDYVAPKWILSEKKVLVVASREKLHGRATVTLSNEGFSRWFLVGYCLVFIAVLCVSLFSLWARICASTRETRSPRVTPALVTLRPGDPQPFRVYWGGVTNQAQAAVAWLASQGTISSHGLYLAPTNDLPAEVIITATSQEDPRLSAHASVKLSTNAQLTVEPGMIPVSEGQTVQFTFRLQPTGAQQATTAPGEVRWTLSPRDAGTLSTNGFYQAPAAVSESRLVTVTAEYDKDPRVAASALVQLTGPVPWCPRSMLLQLGLVLTLGAVGSLIHAISSFVVFVGNRRFVPSWFLWYIFKPFQGAALALVVYLVAGAGMLKVESTGGLLGAAALAVMVGLFSDQALQKLGDVANALFGSRSDKRSNKLDDGQTQATAPQIASVNPPKILKGQSPAPSLTISGAHFADGCIIRLNGMDRTCASTSPTELKLNLKSEDIAQPGSLLLVVVNPDKQNSNEAKIEVA